MLFTDTKSLTLLPLSVGINLVVGGICSILKLPIFLDSIGTILIACLLGPFIGALSGAITNILLSMIVSPIYFPYGLVNLLIGLFSGMMYKYTFFHSSLGKVLFWIIISIVNTLSASLITVFVYGGSSGLNIGSIITASVIILTKNIVFSVFSTSMIENLMDKAIVVLIVYSILNKLPKTFINQFSTTREKRVKI